MTSEEIQQLLSNSDNAIRFEILAMPLATWTLSLTSMLFGILSSHLSEGLFVAVPLGIVGFFASVDHISQWKNVKTHRAESIWQHLNKSFFGP